MAPVPDPKQLEQEREATRRLLGEADQAAIEGARTVERLKLATQQYRERLGLPPQERKRA